MGQNDSLVLTVPSLQSGGTAGLLRAARAGNVEKVLELLNQGGDVNTRNEVRDSRVFFKQFLYFGNCCSFVCILSDMPYRDAKHLNHEQSCLITSTTDGGWRLCFHPFLSICLVVCL